MSKNESSLKNFLETSRLVSKIEADDLWQESEGDEKVFRNLLLEYGKLSEADLQRACGYVWGLSLVDLTAVKIDKTVLQLIPEPLTRTHNVVPYSLTGQDLEVALLDPSVIEELSTTLPVGFKIIPRLTTTSSIRFGLKEYTKILQQQFGNKLKDLLADFSPDKAGQLLELLLLHCQANQASVLHLEPNHQDLLVRFLINGRLYDVMVLPIKILPALAELIKEKYQANSSFLATISGERVVVRLGGEWLEKLNIRSLALENIYHQLFSDRGLILVSGQSVAGKSTFGHQLLTSLNKTNKNIITLEDSFTQRLNRVNQNSLKDNLLLGGANLFRAISRQDPDVILVDEMRERELASLVLNFSLNRGLVVGVVKSKSIFDSLIKFIDLTGSNQAVLSATKLLVRTSLVKRLGDKKDSFFLTSTEIAQLKDKLNLPKVLQVLKDEGLVGLDADWSKIPFYRPVDPGDYEGFIGAYEVVPLASSLKDLILVGANEKELGAESDRLGCLSIEEEALVLAVRGLTSLEEVLQTL